MLEDAQDFSLPEAISHLFSKEWARLVELRGGEAKALEAMDRPDPAFLVFYRQEMLSIAKPDSELKMKALRDEEADGLVTSILAELRRLGAIGRIVASGILANSCERQTIPTEFWEQANVRINTGLLISGAFECHHVRLALGANGATEEDQVAKVAAWLKRRRAEKGDEPKKVLGKVAEGEFGPRLTTREFNSAYSQCYGRVRGRPRKTK